MRSGLRWYDSIFIVLFFYLLVVQVQAVWPFTIDDMYISLRYAKHWAAGDGLLWNLSAPPVEGYSNFSFVVLAALTILLKGNPVVVLKLAGLIGLFFTCYFLYLITRFWFAKRESLLPSICLLLYKGQIIWAVSGLETSVYEALICGAVYFCFRGMGYHFFPEPRKIAKSRFFITAGFLLALAGMTRPEAPILAILFFILIFWDGLEKKSQIKWQGILFFSLPLICLYIPYFLWRLSYFGFFFPNSIYCKGISKEFTLFLDINYLKLIAPFAIFLILGCFSAQDKRHYFLWLPSIIYLILLADSDPIVAFDNRLFLPAFALLLPLVLLGIQRICPKNIELVLFFYFSLLCMAFFFIYGMTLGDYQYFSQNPQEGEKLRAEVLHWLDLHTARGHAVVLADSGMIPYYSDLSFIDSYCLNNVTMAHYPTEKRYEQFCNKISYIKPEVIILTSLIEQGQVIFPPGDVCLRAFLNKQSDYKKMRSFVSANPDSTYRYELFLKIP